MKYKLDQEVLFTGTKSITDEHPQQHKVIVWDYSMRYNEYDIKFDDGKMIHGIQEHEIKEK